MGSQRAGRNLATEQQHVITLGLPGSTSGKEPTCQCRRYKRCRSDLWVERTPWRKKWQPTPVFLPGEAHGQRSLVGYSPWGWKDSDMTERQYTHAIQILLTLSLLRGGVIFPLLGWRVGAGIGRCWWLLKWMQHYWSDALWLLSAWKSLSRVWIFATTWTVQSMEFSRPEYWNE